MENKKRIAQFHTENRHNICGKICSRLDAIHNWYERINNSRLHAVSYCVRPYCAVANCAKKNNKPTSKFKSHSKLTFNVRFQRLHVLHAHIQRHRPMHRWQFDETRISDGSSTTDRWIGLQMLARFLLLVLKCSFSVLIQMVFTIEILYFLLLFFV